MDISSSQLVSHTRVAADYDESHQSEGMYAMGSYLLSAQVFQQCYSPENRLGLGNNYISTNLKSVPKHIK